MTNIDGMSNELGVSPEAYKVMEIFYPYALNKFKSAFLGNQRFVHYTSAETAMNIIRGREIWLRKSTCMNDFMEIEHGFECLDFSIKKNIDRIKHIFDSLFDGIVDEIIAKYNNWLPHFRNDTYILCVSEHKSEEDRTGRLSMWRAYGGDAGVAIVVNQAAFLSQSDALKAYSNPVAYLSPESFSSHINEILSNIDGNRDFLKNRGRDFVINTLFDAFRSATLCTKHPGFQEELEWRVIYSPILNASTKITKKIESINGITQPVCKIKLENIPEERMLGLNVDELVERIIIGPSRYPDVIMEAFVSLLGEAGVGDAHKRVFASDIPLRR